MTPSLLRLARGLLAALAASLLWGTAAAQFPSLPGMGKSAANGRAVDAAPAAPDPDRVLADLQGRLATERRELELLDSPAGLAAGAPPGIDESELRVRRLRLAVLVRTLEQHLSDLARLAKDKARLAALEKDMQAWTGFTEQPPYSILLVDRLRSEELAAETKLGGLDSRAEVLTQTDASVRDRIKLAQLKLRQLIEQAEKSRGEADTARLAWDREQAQLLLRVAQATAGATAAAREALSTEVDIARMEVEFARRKLAKATSQVQFSTSDLEQVRTTLANEADRFGGDIDRLSREQSRRQAAADAAQRALDAARAESPARAGASPAEQAARLRPLERDLELQQAHIDAISARLDALRDAAEFNRALVAQWEARYVASQRPDAAARLTIRENAEKIQSYMALQRKLLDDTSKRAEAAVKDVEKRQEQVSDAAERAFLAELKTVWEERAAAPQQPKDVLDANEFVARQVLAETGGRGRRSVAERSAEWWVRFTRHAAAAWNFELVAVEDSMVVDGKTIAGTRSVTVGKVATALLMIVAGYALAVLLARQGERLLIRRFAWQAAHAGVISRWLLALEFVLLLVIVLAWVKIPITVFAFLGGAVAIGLGFGMQNLLKNLMSGLMILGEKPFRIGDLVEIGGIRGTITNIGLRASTINDANGIETVVPNSTFIEQNLTNWTLTSGRVRFCIRLNVVYGSPVRKVHRLLAEVAERHGEVLDDPPAEVLFEDFGADAMTFALYYWLDLHTPVVPRQVASDLRSMIEASFGDNGIVIAFPQRDVHLDAAKPLAVRIVGSLPPTPAPPSSPPQ